MLFERPDLAKLLGISGCLLSMGIILTIIVKGALPPLQESEQTQPACGHRYLSMKGFLEN
jgi:hypothetical protein